jgi:cyclopropane fatty-acyl-phospholipid synthase-like methyltransferase
MATIRWDWGSRRGTPRVRPKSGGGSETKHSRGWEEDRRFWSWGGGPGTDAEALSADRRYIGVDLSPVQLSIARHRVPSATFLVGDFTTMTFRPSSFDGVVAFYAFDHVAQDDVGPTFASIFTWLRPGGWLMTSLQTMEAEDRVEEWLDVPMFFAGLSVPSYERLLRQTGFELELSEFREEVEPIYGLGGHHWVIAQRP